MLHSAPATALYKKYNADFKDEPNFHEKICFGINFFINNEILHEDVFLRMHVFQSIIMAAIATNYQEEYEHKANEAHPDIALALDQHAYTIDTLVSALQDPDDFPALGSFIKANSEATNTAAARAIRFLYFKKALSQLV